MKRKIFAAGFLGMIGLCAPAGPARADDLVTRSGTTYRDVHPLRVEPDGVTWRHDGGAVKVDFDDLPEVVRRSYHYDAARANAYRDEQANARRLADEQAQHDAKEHETRQRAHAQAVMARMNGANTDAATIFRRALSPAASDATRETAARMQAEIDRRAAAAAANPDPLRLVPVVPGALGPRPVNPFMDTPNAKEFASTLHRSPTGATGNFVPTSVDVTRSSVDDSFYQPLSMTRNYYEDVDRAEAFARGVPLKR